jgi:hypothetical protein
MPGKIIAAVAGFALLSLAAVGAFASEPGDGQVQGELTETPTATETAEVTETAEPTATETPEPTATETPEPTATGTTEPEPTSTDTAEPTATGTPDVSPTPGGEEDDVRGIPDSNPSKHPEDGDGVCEKGETVVKETPSGNLVNVPCHAADKDKDGGEEAEAATETRKKGRKNQN